MQPFVRKVLAEWSLGRAERAFLLVANPVNAEELLSLLWNYPSLSSNLQIDTAMLSNQAVQETPAFLAVAGDAGWSPDAPPDLAMGAEYVEGAPWQPGSSVDLPAVADARMVAESGVAAWGEPIDKRQGLVWPVRDQGQRGTCVAFATAALCEHLAFQASGTLPDLSEQFLYWAIKTQTADPRPNSDGTWLQFARDALSAKGIPGEVFWPYSGSPIPGNISHANGTDPTTPALTDALTHTHTATTCQRGPVHGGNTAFVLRELRQCRPVAISLPVFRDPLQPAGHNWNSPVGLLYGKVLDPPPGSVVSGGHAVCVTGFIPDAGEPGGGYFVIRNSWGTLWGKMLPIAPYHGPETGYGQVSASYVDKFLWEVCRL